MWESIIRCARASYADCDGKQKQVSGSQTHAEGSQNVPVPAFALVVKIVHAVDHARLNSLSSVFVQPHDDAPGERCIDGEGLLVGRLGLAFGVVGRCVGTREETGHDTTAGVEHNLFIDRRAFAENVVATYETSNETVPLWDGSLAARTLVHPTQNDGEELVERCKRAQVEGVLFGRT